MIFPFVLIVLLGMAVYVVFSVHRIFELDVLKKLPSAVKWLLSALPAALIAASTVLTRSVLTSVVIMGHLAGLLILCDILMLLIRGDKAAQNKRRAAACIASLAICTAYVIGGAVNAVTVTPTFYSISTDKDIGRDNLRIIQISDCHLGTTFDGDGFARHIENINAHHPDLLVITGDFVDEDTDREDMLAACAALADVQAPLGVYYVSGNHDNEVSSFTQKELHEAMESGGVTILADQSVQVDNSFYICGRKDAYDHSRLSVEEMMEQTDASAYTVFLDHQPREYADYAAVGADLVLSGHTHGGQMMPLTWAVEFIGMGEKTYGMETAADTTFIVTSGISGFEVPLRTGVKAEFVVIDIAPEQE